jgi:hypothetical protein
MIDITTIDITMINTTMINRIPLAGYLPATYTLQMQSSRVSLTYIALPLTRRMYSSRK